MVALVVRCDCGPAWSPPVRVSLAALAAMKAAGIAPDTLIATVRCRNCGRIIRHTLGDLWQRAA